MTNTLREQLLDHITNSAHTSFVTLSDKFPDHFGRDLHGCLYLDRFPNIILWEECSQEGCDAIASLVSKEIGLCPSHAQAFRSDGRILHYPEALQVRAYKERRWLACSIGLKREPGERHYNGFYYRPYGNMKNLHEMIKLRDRDPLTLRDKLLVYITNRPHTSFVELSKAFPEHFKQENGYDLHLKGQSNIIFWSGLSKEMLDALGSLIRKEVGFYAASIFTYVADGGRLNLPIAQQLTGHRIPHWAPVTLLLKSHRDYQKRLREANARSAARELAATN